MPRKDAYGGSISAKAQQDLLSEGIENFELPKSLVMKIAKSAIPENVKLQKETVLSLVKGSTVFINYLAATAHDVAQSRQHKSISASDVIKALEIMQFRGVSNQCQLELNAYREVIKQAEAKPKKHGKAPTNTAGSSTSGSGSAKGKGKERAEPIIPLPPPFTSTPLPLGVPAPAETEQESGQERPAESISGGGIEERKDEPMQVDNWASQGTLQDISSANQGQDEENPTTQSLP